MNNSTPNDDATSSLKQIKQAQDTIKSIGVKEYIPWFGWGLFILITYPPFDFIKLSLWTPIAATLFIIGMIASYLYHIISYRRVHIVSHIPRYVPLVTFILIFVTILLINMYKLQFHYAYAWTVGGIILATVFFSYGVYLKIKS